MCRSIASSWVLTIVAACVVLAEDPGPIDFNRDIRPILSDKCFACHGPDQSAREADLRLDQPAQSFVDRGGYAVIVAGNAEASELIARVTSSDADLQMPPAASGKLLTADEIDRLRKWIQQGAQWQKHWAFTPPVRPPLPPVQMSEWPQGGIDHFVLSRLEQSGLRPSPRAAKTSLIRRVTLDLTGLPPTLDEIDAFLSDDSPDAYRRVVDRLLESPRYGERMAMTWLDAARYADSHGYSLDRRRVMWPWRNWVIDAYNANLPFDEFVVHQIAGDLLPDATTAQRIATGFNRNHPIQSEGGVINEEYRVETVVDRVETTSAVLLGLTMGCCRCHDHKYDPISQEEFYQFFAFFNNVPETAHVGNRDRQADRPTMPAPTYLQEVRLAELKREISELKMKVDVERAGRDNTAIADRIWIDDDVPAGASSFGNGNGPQTFTFESHPHPVFSGKMSSTRTSRGLGQHGFQNAKQTLSAGTQLFAHVYIDPDNPPRQIMLQWHDHQGWEHRAYWGEDLIDWGQGGTASRRRIGDLPKPGTWVRLEVEPKLVGLTSDSVIHGLAFTQFDGTVYWDAAGSVQMRMTESQRELQRRSAELEQLGRDIPIAMIMGEKQPVRKTFVLNRGQYDQPTKTEVMPGLPAALGTLPDSTADRLTLAKWMISPSNPLTARVAVNRYWQMHFGTGLVGTPEDFGTQGELPSHPALLDWLAHEFVDSGWNVKAMHRMIVLSATYQQSTHATPPLLEVDPENRLLTRGPRFRLPAEMIRDQALSVSGLLVGQLGGPSVRPYQPAGLWDDVVYSNVPRFQQDHGAKLFRRSLYTYWKRSVPPPNMQALDAPSREACVLKRSRTNTPQGALVLMNDPTFVEAARLLAQRAILEAGNTPAQRIEFMFRMVTARPPTASESERIRATLLEFEKDFRNDRSAAEGLLSVGDLTDQGESDAKATGSRETVSAQVDAASWAAYTVIAGVILGLDESITKG